MLLTNRTEKINLFGREYILSQRTARDVNKLIAYSQSKKEKNFTDLIIEAVLTLEAGLKINYLNLKWYQIIKKRSYEKTLSKENLLDKLSPSIIFDLAAKVYELDGVVKEKKKTVQAVAAEHELAGQSQ